MELLTTFCISHSLLLLLLLAIPLPGTAGIRIMEMQVPSIVKVGSTVKLACRYDLEGANLYSLTWWRGAEQFYQFSPSSADPVIIYDSPGIVVDRVKSEREVVVLHNISHATSGKYKCEVLEDYPSFHKDSQVKLMEVIDEPKSPPKLSLSKQQWSPGEELKANCTSPWARPPSELEWYINDIKIPAHHSLVVTEGEHGRGMDMGIGINRDRVMGGRTGTGGTAGLSRTSRLNLVLRESHFTAGGRATLKCDATYKRVYHRSAKVHLINPEYKTAAPSQKLYGCAVRLVAGLWLAVGVLVTLVL